MTTFINSKGYKNSGMDKRMKFVKEQMFSCHKKEKKERDNMQKLNENHETFNI